MEPILAEFEEFARTHTEAGETMDMRSLRDHAAAMLGAIALDLEQPQSDAAQSRKSKGDAPVEEEGSLTAAEKHGTDRADSGFTLAEMFAEYRALRASVLRLWTAGKERLEDHDVQDLIRFNEAIDQALAESIQRYSTSIEHSREMFLAILGHDLRTPLSAVVTAAGFLETSGALDAPHLRMATTIRTSGERMNALVGDLLDFTLSRLGRGIPIERSDVDLGDVGRATVEEVGAMHPSRELRFESSGDLRGRWDGERISQALSNLVGNAVEHGIPDTPVLVTARGADEEIVITVHNHGGPIPGDDKQHIFDPFRRLAAENGGGQDRRSMGLGLYIAEQIAVAHGGSIDVESSEGKGTTFIFRLPRSA
ncbi:MAG TPA: HAMP domain-containing sensor histidine kinase [Longimicrobiales bacterium]|nr:HAMP domain-containing sensor histidine kinase [Longimicrobiales bacterium]